MTSGSPDVGKIYLEGESCDDRLGLILLKLVKFTSKGTHYNRH